MQTLHPSGAPQSDVSLNFCTMKKVGTETIFLGHCGFFATTSRMSMPLPDSITSAGNAEVKRLRSLHERKYRRQTGLFLAEGTRICTEAVTLGWRLHRLAFLDGRGGDRMVRPLLEALARDGGRALPMTESLLSRISGKDNPQMVLGAFEQRWQAKDAIMPDADSCWIALDRVRDPGNLGTIMRTADATGARGVILIGDCTDPYSVEAVRASMGAVFNVELAQMSQNDFLALASGWPGQVVGTALPASRDYRTADYGGPLMLVMGNEQAGLTPELMKACTQLVRMPMMGRSDSLNLAVATGLTLYEVLRQTHPPKGC